MSRKTTDERFDEKHVINPVTECWEWVAYRNNKGYGQFKHEGKMVRAHRFAFERANGPIPKGKQLDHFRRNSEATRHLCSQACVNPAHLEVVTHAENMRRSEWHRASVRANGRAAGLTRRKDDLPEGLQRRPNGKIRVQKRCPIRKKIIYGGTYNTIEEALIARDKLFEEVKRYQEEIKMIDPREEADKQIAEKVSEEVIIEIIRNLVKPVQDNLEQVKCSLKEKHEPVEE